MLKLCIIFFPCCIPVIAIYAMGYLGIIDLSQEMTTGLPRQLLLSFMFSFLLAIVIWFFAWIIKYKMRND